MVANWIEMNGKIKFEWLSENEIKMVAVSVAVFVSRLLSLFSLPIDCIIFWGVIKWLLRKSPKSMLHCVLAFVNIVTL